MYKRQDYKVEVAAPGMTKEDFNIHISENNELVISMEKKNEIKAVSYTHLRFKINLFFNGTPLLMIVKMMTNFLLVTNI